MLLRDSEVAKEVRTQLLNIEEKVEDTLKTSDIGLFFILCKLEVVSYGNSMLR
ncbi:hypothetical protein ORL93_12350 [Bacillus sp. DHT2]|uniref:hypothetical protein n=2 Tax=Bacillus TaxID=1386 RepID=UPI002867BEB5|nr:hypothetical protein [Bacillus pseudomycoides]MCX2826564.1 hypothetical protein [Bacillus sp. DHT2]